MFNANTFNSVTYNGATLLSTAATDDVFSFNGYGLQNANIITSNIDFSTAPTRDYDIGDIPRNHGNIFIDEQWRKRTITLSGHIKHDTAAEMEALIDEIKKELSVRQAELLVTNPATLETRSYVATWINPQKIFAKREGYHLTYCPFEIEFLVADPYAHAEDYTTSFLSAQTAASIAETVTNGGTAHSELVLSLYVASIASFTSLTLLNSTTGESMTITETLAALDVLEIDGEAKTVTLNGSAVDYSGTFVSLKPGDNSIELSLSTASHEIEVTYKHKDSFL